MAGRVTIQDIADALGVSRNTVSKAINNTGILADATREKILQKAIEMGYKQFSYVALTQNAKKGDENSSQPLLNAVLTPDSGTEPSFPAAHGTIALFTTVLLGNSHFSSTMLDKMQRELSQLGYGITMHRILHEEISALKLPNSFIPNQTDAIICIEMFDEAYSDMICDLGLPTLFVDFPASLYASTIKSDRLLMDNRSCIYSFVEEMKRRGKEKIGFLGDHKHCMSFFERYMAFQESLSFADLPFHKDFCLIGPEKKTEQAEGSHYAEYLLEGLSQMSELPEVFICANDFIALDALQAFRQLGISVPDDVWLCGFDDSPESRVVTPRLTTIHIHSQIMGFSAVHLLLSRIKNPGMNFRTIYTETSLIYRESTGD